MLGVVESWYRVLVLGLGPVLGSFGVWSLCLVFWCWVLGLGLAAWSWVLVFGSWVFVLGLRLGSFGVGSWCSVLVLGIGLGYWVLVGGWYWVLVVSLRAWSGGLVLSRGLRSWS